MTETDRSKLPLRQNCEGYFTDGSGNILAQPSEHGYIIFPGGGIESGEDPKAALIRETLEETGAIVRVIKSLGSISYEWPEGWPQTDKQKRRYEQFRGDEMHFFAGVIDGFTDTEGTEEDVWQGRKLVPIAEIVSLIEKMQPFTGTLAPYYSAQLAFLRELQ